MSIKKMSLQQKRELPDDKGHCLYGLMTMKETSNKLRAPVLPPAKNLPINYRLHKNVSVLCYTPLIHPHITHLTKHVINLFYC